MKKGYWTLIACAVILAMMSTPYALGHAPYWFPPYPGIDHMDNTTGTIELEIFGPYGFNGGNWTH